MLTAKQRAETACAGREFREALDQAEKMEVQVGYAWDAVARARRRLENARRKANGFKAK